MSNGVAWISKKKCWLLFAQTNKSSSRIWKMSIQCLKLILFIRKTFAIPKRRDTKSPINIFNGRPVFRARENQGKVPAPDILKWLIPEILPYSLIYTRTRCTTFRSSLIWIRFRIHSIKLVNFGDLSYSLILLTSGETNTCNSVKQLMFISDVEKHRSLL